MQTRGSRSGRCIEDSGAASDVVEEGNPIAAASDQELAEDLIAIVTSFTASYHGRRAVENKKRRRQARSSTTAHGGASSSAEETDSEKDGMEGDHSRGQHRDDREDASGTEEDIETADLPKQKPKTTTQGMVRDPPARL